MLETKSFDEGGYSTMVYSEKIGNCYETGINQPSLIYGINQPGTIFRSNNYRGRALMLTSDEKNSKSKSLNDLTEYHLTEERAKCNAKKTLERLTAVPVQQLNYLYQTESGIEKDAGRCILRALVINAWRCRRRDSEEARETAKNLTNQMESLNMQIYVLKQLLDNEKVKREAIAKEVQSNLLKIEECEREYKMVLEEKETSEIKLKELLDAIMELKDECENQKNNFKIAKMEAVTWETKFNQEKTKSETLKEENLILQKGCRSKHEELINQTQCVNELHKTKEELQRKLDAQISLFNEAWLQVGSAEEKLKLSEESKMQQKVLLTIKDEEINGFRAQIALMEEKIREQDEKNGELGKLLSDKTKELVIANDKLRELTKAEKFWGNRVIKMASICTRIPIACFYTVATLLLPQPSYRVL